MGGNVGLGNWDYVEQERSVFFYIRAHFDDKGPHLFRR